MKLVFDAPKSRSSGARVLANPLFRQRIVRDKKKYSRKRRTSSKKFEDSSQSGNTVGLIEKEERT
jgi:hypothetical protein